MQLGLFLICFLFLLGCVTVPRFYPARSQSEAQIQQDSFNCDRYAQSINDRALDLSKPPPPPPSYSLRGQVDPNTGSFYAYATPQQQSDGSGFAASLFMLAFGTTYWKNNYTACMQGSGYVVADERSQAENKVPQDDWSRHIEEVERQRQQPQRLRRQKPDTQKVEVEASDKGSILLMTPFIMIRGEIDSTRPVGEWYIEKFNDSVGECEDARNRKLASAEADMAKVTQRLANTISPRARSYDELSIKRIIAVKDARCVPSQLVLPVQQ